MYTFNQKEEDAHALDNERATLLGSKKPGDHKSACLISDVVKDDHKALITALNNVIDAPDSDSRTRWKNQVIIGVSAFMRNAESEGTWTC